MSYLVIVESPSKAKSIEKYLGKKYKVRASMGHLRDLPKSKLGIDIENNFEPQYVAIRGKNDIISELKKLAAESEEVYLATDPDREGEAISWHLKELLKLEDGKTKRVAFNEITPKVVLESINNPRDIDINLVDAQQARRLLDRIVGYMLSPLLWKKVRWGLSAGRVQSVVTRLVIDRENEIRAFVSKEYWTLDAILGKEDKDGRFTARFYGDAKGKIEIESKDKADGIINAVKDARFTVKSIKRAPKQKAPAPPFNTSTLQQEASRKLGMVPRRTMAIAQQLYEGIDVKNHGITGLITYMRTDSLRLSAEAVHAARELIAKKFGEDFRPKSARVYKSKSTSQDAHEAIRPTYAELSPDEIKDSLTSEQYKLYKLIWSRFIACQMSNAVYDTISVDIEASSYIFRATSSKITFPGYTAMYVEGSDENTKEEDGALPDLKQGDFLKLFELKPDQHFTTPPSRYTEASLIKAMEEKGIGRPSTYAPTISTILEREYVIKENKFLKPTPLGEVVNSLMMDKFKDIIDVEFTARMEEDLDEIEEGRKKWKKTLESFYSSFSKELEQAEIDLKDTRLKVPDEETDIICELCGRNMVIKAGRFGKFLACPGYPECKNTKAIVEETPGECPSCGGKILKKKSKNGYTYYGCEKFPECTFMTWDVPQKEKCSACGKTLYKRSGRGPKKPFCANPECSEYVPQEKKETPKSGAKAEKAAKTAKTAKTKGAAKKKTRAKSKGNE